MSPSPLGSGVLPPGPPTWRGRLQVRRCDSRRSLGLEPFVSPQPRESGKRLRPPVPSFPERSPAGTRPVAGAETAARLGVRESWARGAGLSDPPVQARGSSARARLSGCGPGAGGKGWALPARPGPPAPRSAYSSRFPDWQASRVCGFSSERGGVPEARLPLSPLGSGVRELEGGVADRGRLGSGSAEAGELERLPSVLALSLATLPRALRF